MDRQDAAAYFTEPRGVAAIWGGLLAAPFAWSLHLITSYALVGRVCESGAGLVYPLLTASTLLVSGLGGWLAWRNWSAAGFGWPDSGGDPVSRSRFLGLSGLLLSFYFALIIITQWVPTLFINYCAK